MNTRVVHIRKDPYDVYVGRPTPYGNPFPLTRYSLADSLEKFEDRVRSDKGFRESLKALRGKTLACWCAPKGGLKAYGSKIVCHAQIIARAADGAYDDPGAPLDMSPLPC